jgi:hypothetical protein
MPGRKRLLNRWLTGLRWNHERRFDRDGANPVIIIPKATKHRPSDQQADERQAKTIRQEDDQAAEANPRRRGQTNDRARTDEKPGSDRHKQEKEEENEGKEKESQSGAPSAGIFSEFPGSRLCNLGARRGRVRRAGVSFALRI